MEKSDKKIDIWDNNVPVEKSSYLNNGKTKYINYENLKIEKNKLTMIDLFCGAGGFAVGCNWSGFQSVVGIDHLKPAIDTWSYNHPNALACLGDIRNIDPKDIKNMLEKKGIRKINLITGGVPCQGFSRANRKHNDNDERNFLFLEYMKYVKVFNPDYIILENVSGMRTTAGGKFEKEIKEAMSELGYETTVKLVNAADYGVPQTRKRLIFVGVKRNTGLKDKYEFPLAKFFPKELIKDGDNSKCYRTVYDAISDLPKLDNNESKNEYSNNNLTEYQKIMRGNTAKLNNHIAPNHPEETIEKIRETKPGKPMYQKFKQRIRLDFEEPSPTQLAGGIRPQFQFGHPDQPRGLSIRERARIQSFPDSYTFIGGIVQERVQTGNAVPPLLIHEITKSIAKDIIENQKRNGENNDV